MHDLIVLLAFFGIVFAPAIIAVNTVGETADGYRHDLDSVGTASESTESGAENKGK